MKEPNRGESSRRTEFLAAGTAVESGSVSPEARGLSRTMRDPACRKRGTSAKTKSRCASQSSATSAGRREAITNGRAGGASSLIEASMEAEENGKRNGPGSPGRNPLAASDDATGTTPAGDAATITAAACSGRDACAEAAENRFVAEGPGEPGGHVDDRRPRASGDTKEEHDDSEESLAELAMKHPKPEAATKTAPKHERGFVPLAFDAPGFVDEMHLRVDIHKKFEDLLDSNDLKIVQRGLELLLEMKYGRGAPSGGEEIPLRLNVDLPKPQ